MSFLVHVSTHMIVPSTIPWAGLHSCFQGFLEKIKEKIIRTLWKKSMKTKWQQRNENNKRKEIRVVVHRNSICSSTMRLPFGSCSIRCVAIINFHISCHVELQTRQAITLQGTIDLHQHHIKTILTWCMLLFRYSTWKCTSGIVLRTIISRYYAT